MNIIVAADRDWGIGRGNELLVRIPADMKRLRSMTAGKTIVMGRKTWDSIPNAPLKGRRNIVLSGDEGFCAKGAVICRSEREALEALRDTPEEDIFIFGGEAIYRLFLPHCNAAYVTAFRTKEKVFADRFFPNLDEDDDWILAERSEKMEYEGIEFYYLKYVRK